MGKMRIIAVAAEGEYARRLVRFLERHVPPGMCVHHFSSVERFCDGVERPDVLLFSEAFYAALPEARREELAGTFRLFLTREEREDGFCIYDRPGLLLDKILALGESGGDADSPPEGRHSPATLVAVYSPVYDPALSEIARSLMAPGDLYLGVEDLGSDAGDGHTMAELCYYIHLREERILEIMEELLGEDAGRFFLPSPDLYFYLRELGEADYRWFFGKLAGSRYEAVYFGMGSGFVSAPEVLLAFDRLILVDERENAKRHVFCERMETFLEERGFSGEIVHLYREEVSDAAAG